MIEQNIPSLEAIPVEWEEVGVLVIIKTWRKAQEINLYEFNVRAVLSIEEGEFHFLKKVSCKLFG